MVRDHPCIVSCLRSCFFLSLFFFFLKVGVHSMALFRFRFHTISHTWSTCYIVQLIKKHISGNIHVFSHLNKYFWDCLPLGCRRKHVPCKRLSIIGKNRILSPVTLLHMASKKYHPIHYAQSLCNKSMLSLRSQREFIFGHLYDILSRLFYAAFYHTNMVQHNRFDSHKNISKETNKRIRHSAKITVISIETGFQFFDGLFNKSI